MTALPRPPEALAGLCGSHATPGPGTGPARHPPRRATLGRLPAALRGALAARLGGRPLHGPGGADRLGAAARRRPGGHSADAGGLPRRAARAEPLLAGQQVVLERTVPRRGTRPGAD